MMKIIRQFVLGSPPRPWTFPVVHSNNLINLLQEKGKEGHNWGSDQAANHRHGCSAGGPWSRCWGGLFGQNGGHGGGSHEDGAGNLLHVHGSGVWLIGEKKTQKMSVITGNRTETGGSALLIRSCCCPEEEGGIWRLYIGKLVIIFGNCDVWHHFTCMDSHWTRLDCGNFCGIQVSLFGILIGSKIWSHGNLDTLNFTIVYKRNRYINSSHIKILYSNKKNMRPKIKFCVLFLLDLFCQISYKI